LVKLFRMRKRIRRKRIKWEKKRKEKGELVNDGGDPTRGTTKGKRQDLKKSKKWEIEKGTLSLPRGVGDRFARRKGV